MSIKTKRPEINFRDTDKIKMLLKHVERSNGERNDSSKDLTIMGMGYICGLETEFGGNFDDETKFETDFKTEANKFPRLTRTIFKNREIDCLRLINETIKKCFRDNTTYRDDKQYIGMCSYLEFLENYNPRTITENKKEENSPVAIRLFETAFNETGKVETQTDINSPGFLEPTVKQFSNLQNSNLPTINKSIIDPAIVWEKCVNSVFDSKSKEAFYAWLVYGKRHNKTISFVLKGRKGKDGKPTLAIAQLRRLIEIITGNVENTKDAFYKDVFDLDIKTAHHPSSPNLNHTFNELTSIIDKNKTTGK